MSRREAIFPRTTEREGEEPHMPQPNDRRKEMENDMSLDAPASIGEDEGGLPRTGQQALGGNDIDQSRRGASVDEGMLTKGERRRGGQDVR